MDTDSSTGPGTSSGTGASGAARWATVGAWCAALMTLALGWRATQEQRAQSVRDRQHATERINASVAAQFSRFETLIGSGRALFAASDEVTAGDWARFAQGLGIPDRVPGLRAFSFNPWTDAANRSALEDQLRRRVDPNFAIRPVSDREPACPVAYIQPPDARNALALGFDTFSEPLRRRAIEEARDTGELRLTPRLRLVQSLDDPQRAGFLMIGPVYHAERPGMTVEERRAAFRGVVVVAFELPEFMSAAARQALAGDDWSVAVVDRTEAATEVLLAQHLGGTASTRRPAAAVAAGTPRLPATTTGGRTWEVRLEPLAAGAALTGRAFPLIVLLSGATITGLLLALRRSLATTERRARDLATDMTRDLRQTRDALRRTAEELAAILDALPDLVLRINPEGRILGFHSASVDTPNQTPSRYVGRPLDSLLPAATAKKLLHSIAEAARTGNLISVDYSHPLAGVLRHFEARIRRFGAGELVMLTRDITARVRAAEGLAESEQRFSKAFHSSLAGLCITRLDDWTLIDVNDAFLAVFGYTRPEMIGRTAPELGIWVDLAERDQARDQLRLGHVLRHVETRFRRKSGEVGVLLHSAELVEINNRRCVLSVVLDITERKRAEELLRQSEQRLRTIVETIQQIFWVAQPGALAPSYLSPAAERIWGRPIADLLAVRRAEDTGVLAEDFPRLLDAIQRQAQGQPTSIEYRIRRPDGSVRWLWDQGFPVCNADGAVVAINGIATDITESKSIEAQLRESQKMQAIGTLAGGVAHDFNNILGSLICFADLAHAASHDHAEIRSYLDEVLQASRRAKEVVQQLLAFSRRQESFPRPLDLGDAVGEVERLLRAGLSSQIELATVVEARVPAVLADPTQIHQLLMNLATNAAHAMRDRGGRLLIEVSAQPAPARQPNTLRVLESHAHEFVRLRVRDSGCGMESGVRDRVFEPFFTTKPPGEGTGLGLAVVHGIVRDHRGILELTTAPGQGSTFDAYFPASPQAVPPTHPAPPPNATPRGQGQRILLVDDEPGLVRAGKRALEFCGYRVTSFCHPESALEALRQAPDDFDLLITDLSMPGMDGTLLTREALRIRPNLPVLLATGFAGSVTSESATHAGVRGILSKPVDLQTLGDTVFRTLQER